MRARLDPLRARFRIRNMLTGRYLCTPEYKIMLFDTRTEAMFYIDRVGLNRDIYVTEAVL